MMINLGAADIFKGEPAQLLLCIFNRKRAVFYRRQQCSKVLRIHTFTHSYRKMVPL